MATDSEILKLHKSLSQKSGQDEAIISLYRAAQKEGISSFEADLLSDGNIQAAMKTFGWGRNSKTSLITVRALMREALRLAKEKAGK